MGQAIGIDLGTTYSCVAHLEEGRAKVIPNLDGQPITPSVVCFTSSGEKIVGNLALRQATTNPDQTVFAIKRFMGKKFNSEDVQQMRDKIPYKLTEAENGDVVVDIDSNLISPQEISSMILSYLKRCAESYLGKEVDEAVVTVPAHFNDHQRQATKVAAEIAGLKVLRVLNEPTAASLAYGLDTKNEAVVAVYDMGGGTYDITLMEVSEGVFNVLATNGSSLLGGEDFDNRILDWLIEDFKKEFKIDLTEDKFALQRMKEAAEKAKKELSFMVESEINLPFIWSDKEVSRHIKKTLTRALLEELTNDIVDKTFPYIDQALADGKIDASKIEEVILVGGQTRMPLIKEKISEFFGKDPVQNINPEEIVAVGAAIQSGILKGRMTDIVVLLDVTPLSLGIETENNTFVRIIERNTTIPAKKTMPFTTVEDNQRRVKIHVLQGENEIASLNKSLAVFDLVGIQPAPAGIPQIDVTFEIDADGLVKVSARDVKTGMEQKIEVRPSAGLTTHEINQIIKRTRGQETEKKGNGKKRLL